MTESEIWKDVVGYEGLYEVSDKGNVRSVERKDSIGRKCGGRVLKPINNGHGYLQVDMCKNGKAKKKRIHRLVAEAFIPNPKGFLEINHKDENKSNNELSNLEWCTREYNINYGKRTEKVSKKVRAINIKTGEVFTFNSIREAGRKGYVRRHVSKACLGVYNAGGGNLYRSHRWSYEDVEGNESK